MIATNAKGVGRAFYEGASQCLVSMGVTDFTNRCRLMQLSSDDPAHCQGIRKAFLGNVHVCVFVGGSAGTREEYQIVRASSGFAVPIGASGGVAHELWRELEGENRARLAPRVLQAFLSLGDVRRTNEEHVSAAIEIIEARVSELMLMPGAPSPA